MNGLAYCQEFDNIFALGCHCAIEDVTQNVFHKVVHEITLNDCTISLHTLRKEVISQNLIEQNDLVNSSHSFTVKHTVKESNIFM